jgi:hypothetical protein
MTSTNTTSVKTCEVNALAIKLNKPQLPELCRRFLYGQLNPHSLISPEDVFIDDCPPIRNRILHYHSGHAIFYAPSEDSGVNGMHYETIHSNPKWRNKCPRYDTVLIQNGNSDDVMGGMLVGRVLNFLSLTHSDICHNSALVEWFLPYGEKPDPVTGMWLVRPEQRDGKRHIGLVHTECIVRGCHLIGVYGKGLLPKDFHFSFSLDAFNLFYVNKYIRKNTLY